MGPAELRTRAGKLLYHELPEEYRFRDAPPVAGDLADLEAYLHSFGHLLDLIRRTTEQAYADSFAEPADNGRQVQSWLIPYLAELVGAELRSPDLDTRRRELDQTVGWYKSKGSLECVDSIADVLGSDETVVVEGWRRTLTAPRMSLPPFTIPASEASGEETAWEGGPPLGIVNGFVNRAVADPAGTDPHYRLSYGTRDQFGRVATPDILYWRPLARRGTACFPGAFDDTAVRTPDLSYPGARQSGPHPQRTIVYVRPPEGFFAAGLDGSLSPTTANLAIDPAVETRQVFGPVEIFRSLGLLDEDKVGALLVDGQLAFPDRLVLDGDLTIPSGTNVEIHDLLFTGTIKLADESARLTLRRCAVEQVRIVRATDDPALVAEDCLFNSISGGLGFAQLVQCTVLETTELERLHASDCIFAGDIIDLDCSGEQSCIRFSRVPDLAALAACGAQKSPSNSTADPNFLQLWFEDGQKSVLRPALFGEPGAGVLDLTSSEAIIHGAENHGEMGAYNHMFHAARIRALRLKLEDYLPFGQEIAIQYDPCLARRPPTLA